MERNIYTRAINELSIEQRSGQPAKIVGLAACYYDGSAATEYDCPEGFVERLLPGAFDKALERKDDVLCCVDHDKGKRLGRTPTSLKLWTDQRGLHYEVEPVNTETYRDTLEEIRSGILRGSSYKFGVAPGDVVWKRESGVDIREIRSLTLYDVSPCPYPCNSQSTTVAVRSKDLDQEYRDWQETQTRIEKAELLLRSV